MQLATITEIIHYDKDGKIIWNMSHSPNVFHNQGQEFVLKSTFATALGIIIPASYYVGLDNRTTLNQSDDLQTDITGEPTGNGYSRQSISSSTGFGVSFVTTDWIAQSSTLLFTASGGSWGPVKNAFLATGPSTTGYLISSLLLDPVNNTSRTLNSGEILTFRINLALDN